MDAKLFFKLLKPVALVIGGIVLTQLHITSVTLIIGLPAIILGVMIFFNEI